MTPAKAILDFVGFPPIAPGSLECRLAKTLFTPAGEIVDQGRRPDEPQRQVHRFVVEPGQSIEQRIAAQDVPGYELPDPDLIRHLADYEWRDDVLTARRRRLATLVATPAIVVKALGFNLLGEGELAVQLAKVTFAPRARPMLTAKAKVTLRAGDPLDLFIMAVDAHAERISYVPLAEVDAGLLKHVSAKVFSPAAIEERDAAWRTWEIENEAHCRRRGIPALTLQEARIADFLERIEPLKAWHPVPIKAPERSLLN